MSDVNPEQEEKPKGPGELLRERRVQKGLDITSVAEKLHLKATLLSDIEAEQYDPALSVTFTKGYIRLYAKFLELDPEELLALFEKQTDIEKQPTKLKSFSQKVAKQASDARLMMVTYFIAALVIGLLFVWWWQQGNEVSTSAPSYIQTTEQTDNSDSNTQQADTQTSAANNIPEPEIETQFQNELVAEQEAMQSDAAGSVNDSSDVPNEPNNEEVNEELDSLTNEEETLDPVDAPESQVLDVFSSDEETTTTETDVSQSELIANENTSNSGFADSETTNELVDETQLLSTEPATVDLVFQFSGDCWMNLTDATGEVIAYGVKRADYVMPVSGVPPFEVILGAPQVVSISVAGQPFDMSQFPAGRTARFTILDEVE